RLCEGRSEAGVVATVPFVYRFYATVREARARIRQGESGPLWLLDGSYLEDRRVEGGGSNWGGGAGGREPGYGRARAARCGCCTVATCRTGCRSGRTATGGSTRRSAGRRERSGTSGSTGAT